MPSVVGLHVKKAPVVREFRVHRNLADDNKFAVLERIVVTASECIAPPDTARYWTWTYLAAVLKV